MQENKSQKNFKIKKLSIVGVIPSFAFQRAKYCALELHRKLPQRFPLPNIIGLLELDWSEKLLEWRQTLGREYWCLRRPVAVFFDDRFIGSDIELIKLMTIGNILMESIPRQNMAIMKKNFRDDYISHLRKSKRIFCYLDVFVDEVYAGTLTFQLYSDMLPRTCENFKSLCLGSRGPLLSYRGSRIHRIVKKGWLQGGDIQYKTGGGGFSIFCDPLEDECFGISHDRRGVLSMANTGNHTNGSQFFITLQPSKWMDTHYVAFGQLVEGVKVLHTIENLETVEERPLKKVEIKSCGKLDLEDVEDVDALYKEEPMPAKKKNKIETISEQVVRLIFEELTKALKRKEHIPDILDDGDVPSKMNLQLFFQGFYSLSETVLEETEAYLSKLRRQLLRMAKPSATEVVEVILYDLLMAVLSRMTTLDDIRETIGHELYKKMISGIEMKLEFCRKSYVKKLVDQIVSTACSMVNLVAKKVKHMKKTSQKLKKFQEEMQGWVQSFVLQETFESDNFFIANRNVAPEKPKEKTTKKERKKKEELKAKLRAKYGPADLCCLGSKLQLSESIINVNEFFSTCRYGLKKEPKNEEVRMPLIDLLEIGRFKLKWLRKHQTREKDQRRLCVEKKIRKWMEEVTYVPETSWLKDVVFPRDCVVFDHLEEIMYGAMTAGLLEMYYFMEEYEKLCGGKKKMITRTIYPEDWDMTAEEVKRAEAEGSKVEDEKESWDENYGNYEEFGEGREIEYGRAPAVTKENTTCPCGHPCCKCPYDLTQRQPPPPPPSLMEGEDTEDIEDTEEGDASSRDRDNRDISTIAGPPTKPDVNSCASDETLFDMNAAMAETLSLNPEEIDINSFKWLRPYILEKGCDLKSEFAAQVHKWLEGERFNSRGFISKHSLATRASLLSLSLSLAGLIKEENNPKEELKNFIYDLWNLYFEEMVKEAIMEVPQDPQDLIGYSYPQGKSAGQDRVSAEELPSMKDQSVEEEDETEKGKSEERPNDLEDECKRILEMAPHFDFEKYCAKLRAAGEEEFSVIPEDVEKKPESAVTVSHQEQSQKSQSQQSHSQQSQSQQSQSQQSQSQREPKHSIAPSELQEFQKQETSATETVSTKYDGSYLSSDITIQPKNEKSEVESKKVHEEGKDDGGKGDGVKDQAAQKEAEVKKKKLPIVVTELVDVPSDDKRKMPPYVLPFWVKFLTELTKQALGAIAKVSRLPRRLYFQTDSELAFDDRMKEWFEFNAFNPQPTKGREIMDFIALQHKTLTNLEDTARSFLKKKKLSGLLNRCTRFTSSEDVAAEIIAEMIETAMNKTQVNETLELFVSNLLSSAIVASPGRSQASIPDEDEDFNTFDTNGMESEGLIKEEESESLN